MVLSDLPREWWVVFAERVVELVEEFGPGADSGEFAAELRKLVQELLDE